jgi:hypothetical protein
MAGTVTVTSGPATQAMGSTASRDARGIGEQAAGAGDHHDVGRLLPKSPCPARSPSLRSRSTRSSPYRIRKPRSGAFANVARHLRPGARFVVEAWVPDASLAPGPSLRPRQLAQATSVSSSPTTILSVRYCLQRRWCSAARPVCGCIPWCTDMRIRRSWTSWPDSPGCASRADGPIGEGHPS